MSNRLLLQMASSDRRAPSRALEESSTPLLTLQRFIRRSLKQIGAGLLSLILVWGISAHGATMPLSHLQPLGPLYDRAQAAATIPKSSTSQHLATPILESDSGLENSQRKDSQFENSQHENSQSEAQQYAVASAVLPTGDKPFQALRPKMTFHRLTTSRLSIPAEDYRQADRLPELERK